MPVPTLWFLTCCFSSVGHRQEFLLPENFSLWLGWCSTRLAFLLPPCHRSSISSSSECVNAILSYNFNRLWLRRHLLALSPTLSKLYLCGLPSFVPHAMLFPHFPRILSFFCCIALFEKQPSNPMNNIFKISPLSVLAGTSIFLYFTFFKSVIFFELKLIY